MGISNTHALGRNQKFFARLETVAGTFERPISADAARVLQTSIDHQLERRDRVDSHPSRSVLERITGKGSLAWTLESYILPSGTAGTPPDIHPLLYASFGVYTNTPATSDVYSLNSAQTVQSLSMTRNFNDVLQQSVWGAWVESFKVTASGGDEPKFTFEGGARGFAHTGTSTLNGAMSSSATMVVQTVDALNFQANSLVQVGSDNNTGVGLLVTADASRPSFTLDNTASASNGAEVIPYVPAQTTAGSPINMITGSLTVDGVSMPITSFELTLANQFKIVDDEAFAIYPTDAIAGWRSVTGTIQVRARKDWVIELGKLHAFTLRDIAVTLGSGAGRRCKIDMNTVEFEFAAADTPSAEEVVINLPFKALGSGAGDNEITLTFD